MIPWFLLPLVNVTQEWNKVENYLQKWAFDHMGMWNIGDWCILSLEYSQILEELVMDDMKIFLGVEF